MPSAADSREDPRVVFALDLPKLELARDAALQVRDAVGMLKVGLELFIGAGPAAMAIGREASRPVFLDLKLCDIPETVDRAVARACALGARVLTVHASGGPAMLARAVARAAREGTGLEVAAVTVLTSLDESDLDKLGVTANVGTHARRLARLGLDAGIRAFVCSPREVAAVRSEVGVGPLLFTPGVRPSQSAASIDDQKRVATATRAVQDGADWVVVGRPIRDSVDPLATARDLASEVAVALARRGART